jgi:dTDP-4-amino-4,6-dideoxygalactose transaminase
MTPFIQPHFGPNHGLALMNGMRSMEPQSLVRKLETKLADRLNRYERSVVCTNSCTNGLYALALAHQRCFGESRIFAPAFTWPGSYRWARLLRGRKGAVLVDSTVTDPNMSEDALNQRRVYQRERYGVVNHLAVFVNMWGRHPPQWLYELDIPFIIDAAHHPLFADDVDVMRRNEHCLGVVYSCYETKLLAGLRGGVIVARDNAIAEVCRRVIHPSHNEFVGAFNGQMSDASAAVVSADMDTFDERWGIRQELQSVYLHVDGLAGSYLHCGAQYTVLQLPNIEMTVKVRQALRDADIRTGCHYPVHEWFSHSRAREQRIKGAWLLSKRIITLPMWCGMPSAIVYRVRDIIRKALTSV